jgi:hypothetical protein
LAFNKLELKNTEIWNKLEKAFDKILHKLKAKQIVFILDLFNRDSIRGTKDIYTKLFTILPIHIHSLNIGEMIQIMRVYVDQDIKNERLLKYFIFPRIEKKIPVISLDQYISTLNVLADLGFEEDKVFWIDHVLPGIFQYDYAYDEITRLWEALLKVKVNCPTIDLAKFMLIIENLLKQFNLLKEKGEDINTITLSVDEQYKTTPKKTEEMSLSKIKEAQRRLKHQPSLQGFLEGIKDTEQKTDVETSFANILNIKDWNKAKYETEQAELKKAREAKEEEIEAKKKLMAEKKEARKKEEEEKKTKEESLSMTKSEKKEEEAKAKLEEQQAKVETKEEESKDKDKDNKDKSKKKKGPNK